MDILRHQAKKINALEIQGATNIAIFAVRQFTEFVRRNSTLPKSTLWKFIRDAEKILVDSRPTEPTMRNGLLFIIGNVLEDKERTKGAVDLVTAVEKHAAQFEVQIHEAKARIAEIGAKRLPVDPTERFTVMTHCHSSIVEAILFKAHQDGRKFDVICTETRPKFQGRITAMHLHEAGIKVHMIVDSAMRWACKYEDVDLIIIGADAITSEGTVVNKIGSRLLALVAEEENIPFYVASPLLKYNIETLSGTLEKIERRDTEEVWSKEKALHINTKPPGIDILNPAFETVARRYIAGIITEAGLFPPDHTHFMFEKKYPFLVNGLEPKADEYEGWQ